MSDFLWATAFWDIRAVASIWLLLISHELTLARLRQAVTKSVNTEKRSRRAVGAPAIASVNDKAG
jgi:hypothetical protein